MLDRSLPLLDYAAAVSRRDVGMGLAADAADRSADNYTDRLYAAIKRVALVKEFFYVDDVTEVFPEQSPNPNANGTAWRKAAMEKRDRRGRLLRPQIIERTGRLITSARKSTHAHSYPEYRSLIFKRA